VNIFGESLTYVEMLGTLFGIAGVWLVVKKHILNFPVGIINVSLYAWLFLQTKLYADASLQIIYIILLFYGWTQWRSKDVGEAFHSGRTSAKLWILLTVIFILSTLLIGTLFQKYTDAALPYFDSMLTTASLIAQWMIAKRKIENWIIWIVADVLYVAMYIYKELYFTSVLYLIFILLAIAGYKEWKKVLITR
jgi:nicotinamide mononucleotide transporter